MEIFPVIYTPQYLDQVAEWLYREWEIKTKGWDRTVIREKLENFINIDKIPINYVALKGEKMVRTFNFRMLDQPARKDLYPWLGSLYVESKFRNQGISSS